MFCDIIIPLVFNFFYGDKFFGDIALWRHGVYFGRRHFVYLQ
jgi:hypothetical protein